MNSLSRLDSYVSSLFVPASSSFPSSSSSFSSTGRPRVRRFTTPPSQVSSSSPSYPLATSSSTPRLSNLPPTPRRGRSKRSTRRRAPQTYSSIKVPPPTTPLILRIALVLWSILLSFWRSLVGETRAGRSRKRKGVRARSGSGGGGGGVLRELGERVMVSAGIGMLGSAEGDGEGEGSGSEAEPMNEEGDDGWVDPVTRVPEDQDSLDAPLPTEDEFAVASREDEPNLAETQAQAQARADPSKFTFRLKSAPLFPNGTIDSRDDTSTENDATRPAVAGYQRPPTPRSILSNPMHGPTAASAKTRTVDDEEDQKSVIPLTSNSNSASSSTASRKTPKILANPISTSILDPSVPAPSSNSASSLFRKASPPLRVPRLHQTPFHLQKTLILDLDETLIHSTSRPLSGSSSGGGGILGLSLGGLVGRGKGREGHAVEVVLNGRSTMYHVYKRPYVDHFLKKVASWYTLVIFTASMPEYADPVIDWLDAGRNLFARKLYRDSCHLQPNGSYTKDLSLVEADLSRVCFMDNSPVSYNWNKANALPIEGWTSDPYDEALLHSIPVLDSLRFVNDVRRVLGIRGFT
ncbi:nuclear envelope-endoplasmic reticulum network protein [Kwoniella heveanensis BCC8398]|uniref:Nuclear envelope-endoplasmic reticulum network protein n=1 Tax=Kwoniella heveanensis BCC8398 TaxID=1296120 RepID=A0A1B9GRQ2_9TREE|nr:nuclear envelope-endoplasmic reticulum network protein [Kwoniella heveanensis BCC8398]